MATRGSMAAAILVMLTTLLSAHAGDALWTLDRCIKYALDSSRTVQTARLDSVGAVVGVEQARGALWPSLSASAGYSVSGHERLRQSTQYSLGADWTVFRGLSRLSAVRQSETEVRQSTQSLRSTELTLAQNIATAYLQALYAREELRDAQRTDRESAEQVQRTRAQASVGRATAVDVAGMEAQHAADAYALVTAENRAQLADIELRQVIGLAVDQPFEPFCPDSGDSLVLGQLPAANDLYAAALAAWPVIAERELAVQAAEEQVRQALAGYSPTLGMSAGVSTGQTLGDDGSALEQLGDNALPSLSVRLNVPLLDGRATRTHVARARIDLAKARLSLAQAHDDLRHAVESAVQQAAADRASLASAQSRLAAARAAYDLAREKAGLGMLQAAELLTQTNAYLAARAEFVHAKFAALLSTVLLDLYRGRMPTMPGAQRGSGS